MYSEILTNGSNEPDVTIRPLSTRAVCEACVQLQRTIWGQDFVDVVPATMLMVSQRVGGVASGAFDQADRLIGFVFGISGVRNGRLSHWSDMLAVTPPYRRTGLGTRLKQSQRQQLLDLGIGEAFWSFDPLMAANAAFNLNRLGAIPVEYMPDMYGETKSPLHRGLATDRLIVSWRLMDPRVQHALEGTPPLLPPAARQGPIVSPRPFSRAAVDSWAPHMAGRDWVRVTIPANLDELKRSAPRQAEQWQQSTRDTFTWHLTHGYRVAGFQPAVASEPPWYALTTEPDRSF